MYFFSLQKITEIKQVIDQKRNKENSLTIQQQFDEWLKCCDKIVSEQESKSYVIPNQNQWNSIGLTMQIFVTFQSIIEMMKDIETNYRNIFSSQQLKK